MINDAENPQQPIAYGNQKPAGEGVEGSHGFSLFLSEYNREKIKYIPIRHTAEDDVIEGMGSSATHNMIRAKKRSARTRRFCTLEFMVIVGGVAFLYAFYSVVIRSTLFYNPDSRFTRDSVRSYNYYWPHEGSPDFAAFQPMLPDFTVSDELIMTEVKLAYMPEEQVNLSQTDGDPLYEEGGQHFNETLPDFTDSFLKSSYYEGELAIMEVKLVDKTQGQGDEDRMQYQNALNMTTAGVIKLTSREDRFQYPINMLADLQEWPVPPSDVLYFWHIPKTAGTSLKHVLEFCYGLIRAEKYRDPQSLEILYKGKHRFVNVGTDTPTAIIEARKIKLVESGMAQTIATSFFYEGSFLFTPDHKGRMITLLRHPVERAHSLFHYLSQATWEPTYDPVLASMSFLEYGRSNRAEDNWIVRYLTNRKHGPLSYHYVDLATEVLRTKCLVGFMDYFEESIRRIEKYFGYREIKPGCTRYYIDTPVNKFPHPPIEVGSVEWNLFARINRFDVKLYENAKRIFVEQGVMLGSFIE